MAIHVEAQRITHEAERISRARIVLTTIWTLLFSGLLAGASVVVWNARTRSLETQPPPRAIRAPVGDISNVRIDLIPRQVSGRGMGIGAGETLRRKQHRELEQFGWADPSHRTVRIPIDDAIELELQEHRR
jgi:hypothetical protein